MATYKYQQNLYDGAAEGYVKYNITPAPGTYVAPGESVTISGQAYWRDGTIYGVLMDLFLGDPWEGPDNYRHATVCQKAVKISKGKTGTFSMSFTLTEEDALVLGEFAGRAFDAQLVFTLADDSTLSSGSETRAVAAQKVSILKNRVSPVIEQAMISDVTDAAAVFGDFVQGQSRLKMTMQATADPLDSAVTIASRVLTLGAVEHTLSSDEEEVGAVDRSGAVGWTLKVTDSKGLSAETSGTISLLPYQPPVISALSAQRYREVVADDGTVSYIADEEGEHVRFSLNGAVTSVSGKNAWTLSVGWNGRQSEVRSGTDGAEIVLINDRDAVPDGVSAAERVEFAWTLQDHFTSVTLRTTVDKSGAYFNVETDGVAVGMRTTGKPDKKKFEVAEGYESHFYGGVYGAGGYPLDKPKKQNISMASGWSAYHEDYVPSVSRVGPVVYMFGLAKNGSQLASGATATIGTIPEWARPSAEVQSIQQGYGNAIFRLSVSSSGEVQVSKHRNGATSNAVAAGAAFSLCMSWIAADAYE